MIKNKHFQISNNIKKYFYFALFLISILFFNCNKSNNKPLINNGVIDLRGIDLEKNGEVSLNGNWEFYWNRLLLPKDFNKELIPKKDGYIKVPGVWNGYKINEKKINGMGYATYRLNILIDKKYDLLSIKIFEISSAYKLYVNRKIAASCGTVSKSKKTMKPAMKPLSTIINTSNTDKVELVLQVSNLVDKNGGFFYRAPLFGTIPQIKAHREKNIIFQIFLFGCLMIIGFYHIALYLLNKEDISSLFFSVVCLLISLRLLVTGAERVIYLFKDFNFLFIVKIEYLTYYLTLPFFHLFLRNTYPKEYSKKILYIILIFSTVSSLLIIFTSITVMSYTLISYHIFTGISNLYFIYVILIAIKRKLMGSIYFLIGCIIIVLTVTNDILYGNQIIFTFFMSPFGFFLFILIQSFVLSKKFSLAFHKIQNHSKELEQTVAERTKELAESNEKLKELDKLKTNFFANISHEFRTPLTLILGPIESIISGEYGKKLLNTNPVFDSIKRNSKRLLKLINNLLDFSKIEASKMRLTKETVNISELLKYYISSVEIPSKDKGLALTFKSSISKLLLNVDKDLIEKVFFNIFGNAFKFTEKGGKIIITLDKDNEFCIISITDTGIGIPENKLKNIFERFSQVDDSSSKKHEGTGIGLSLANEIIKLHYGKITVTSTQGEGSTFKIYLPIEKNLNNPTPIINENTEIKTENLYDFNISKITEFKETEKHSQKNNILIIEDNKDMQNYLKSILKNKFNIYSAENGKSALDILNSIPKPDLIISDLMMPVMDGKEFFEKLKNIKKYTNIPFIFLTAKSETNFKIESLKKGAIDYIKKPFNKNELIAKMESILKHIDYQKENVLSNVIETAFSLSPHHKRKMEEKKLSDADLTKKEKEITNLAILGLENKEIADQLYISVNTVRNHIKNIYKKLNVSSRKELILKLKK